MDLGTEQTLSFDGIIRWALNPEASQSFTLAGFAGTGKTTLMRAVVEALRQLNVKVFCCAPTGKAASVLQRKLGNLCRVTTVHSFIYAPVEVTEADLVHASRTHLALVERAKTIPHLEEAIVRAEDKVEHITQLLNTDMCDFKNRDMSEMGPIQIVIVDECSMIDEKMEGDLRQIAPKILFLGDGGQLPPVNGQPFYERNKPEATLTEIHRQTGNSGILCFATDVRNGWFNTNDLYSDVVKVWGEPTMDQIREADVIITGRNDTRRNINRLIRRDRGHEGSDYPKAGEPVMCLRNDYRLRLVNGIGGVMVSDAVMNLNGTLDAEIMYEGEIINVQMDTYNFTVYYDPDISRRTVKSKGCQFDFGYAITCHKSQGSEWDTVMVWDDHMREHDVEARKRWMYTAITRAAKKLIWVDA